jgi:hypothetical protein
MQQEKRNRMKNSEGPERSALDGDLDAARRRFVVFAQIVAREVTDAVDLNAMSMRMAASLIPLPGGMDLYLKMRADLEAERAEDWTLSFATIQTSAPGGNAVCCPTTIIASVDANAFTAPGTYSGALTITADTSSTILNYSVTAANATLPPPITYPSGPAKIAAVTSAASFSSSQVSAEGYVAIFGSDLADKIYVSPSASYGLKLGSTEVFVCPSVTFSPSCPAARMVFASPTQINAVLTGISGNAPPSSTGRILWSA